MSWENDLDDLMCRILRGEDVDAVLAEFEHRDDERRAWYEAERARLQLEIDCATAVILRHEGRLQ